MTSNVHRRARGEVRDRQRATSPARSSTSCWPWCGPTAVSPAWPRRWPWPARSGPSPSWEMPPVEHTGPGRGAAQRRRAGHRRQCHGPPRRRGPAVHARTSRTGRSAFGPWGPLARSFGTSSRWSNGSSGRPRAAVLEVAADHALIEMVPRGGEARHAHLCEMTRGLLSQVPVLFGLDPAIVTETECSARGGRRCLYAVSWEDPVPDRSPDPRRQPAPMRRPAAASAPAPMGAPAPLPVDAGSTPVGPIGGEPGPADHAVELREQLNRMSLLVGGAFATSLELPYDDVDAVLAEIAARADAVVSCAPLPPDGPGRRRGTDPDPLPGPRERRGPASGR